MDHLVDHGNVEDIRCSLSFGTYDDVAYLHQEIKYEIANRNRSTVIKMLQARIRKLGKAKK